MEVVSVILVFVASTVAGWVVARAALTGIFVAIGRRGVSAPPGNPVVAQCTVSGRRKGKRPASVELHEIARSKWRKSATTCQAILASISSGRKRRAAVSSTGPRLPKISASSSSVTKSSTASAPGSAGCLAARPSDPLETVAICTKNSPQSAQQDFTIPILV